MSILSALHQQNGQLDELAKLPQAMIMQMAQRKEISPDMVAPILSRKAELADSIARTKAMQGAGGQQPTVMEQLMQKNAEQHMPKETHEAGIAQLPVEEPQYAGGGIVAFSDNENQPVDADMKREGESENDYLKRSRGLVEGVKNTIGPIFNPVSYDLPYLYQRDIGQPFAKYANEVVDKFKETPTQQADRFRSYSQQPKTEAAALAKAPKATDAQYEEQGRNAYVSNPVKAATAASAPSGSGTEPGIKALTKQSPLQKVTGAPDMQAQTTEKPSAIDALIEQLRADIKGNPEEAKRAREEARNQRMLQAGLDVMGGTSPYAFANLGLAGKAAAGFGEDVKGLRAEESEKKKQLATLGLKGVELKQAEQKIKAEADYMKMHGEHFKNMDINEKAKIGLMSQANTDTKTAALVNSAFSTLMGLHKNDIDKDLVNPSDLYAEAQRMVSGTMGKNIGGNTGAPAPKVPVYNPATRTFS